MDSQVRVITAPEPVVTLEEAKRHLIVDHDDDDDLIRSLIASATMWLDGPTGWLGRSLGVQTLELRACDFFSLSCQFDIIPLPFPPVLEIISISYLDSNDALVVLPSGRYEATLGGVRPLLGSWPNVGDGPEAVRIQYRVGQARADPNDPDRWIVDVASPIKTAILMLVAQWYAVREAVSLDTGFEKLPFAVEALLQPYRIYR
nr:head-tail connector protein [Brucella anthropi]